MPGLRRRLLGRCLQLLLVVWGCVTIVFFLSRVLPSDPAVLLSGPEPSPEVVEATRARLGLDRPLLVQYGAYLHGLVKGDLGRSVMTGQTVMHELSVRLPATLELLAVSLGLAVLSAFGMAIRAAKYPGGIVDRAASALALLRTAIPTFFAAILLVYLFYTVLAVAPAPLGRLPVRMEPVPVVTRFHLVDSLLARRWDAFLAAMHHLALPAVTLATSLFPSLLRVLRSSIRLALQSDALIVLRLSPISPWLLWRRYILPLAMTPTLTLLAASFGSLVGGTVIVEHIFAWNGVGSYVLNGIEAGDYPVVQGVVLVSAFAYSLAFLVSDVVSWLIDPRLLEETDGAQVSA